MINRLLILFFLFTLVYAEEGFSCETGASVCSGHGICLQENLCLCNENYIGLTCQTQTNLSYKSANMNSGLIAMSCILWVFGFCGFPLIWSIYILFKDSIVECWKTRQAEPQHNVQIDQKPSIPIHDDNPNVAVEMNQLMTQNPKTTDTLHSPKQLEVGQFMVSQNGKMILVMEFQGCISIYKDCSVNPDGSPNFGELVWSSLKTGLVQARAPFLCFNQEGNIEIKEDNHSTIVHWTSNLNTAKFSPGTFALKIHNDGHLSVTDSANHQQRIHLQ